MGYIGKELSKLLPLTGPLMVLIEIGYTLHVLAAIKAAAVLFRSGPDAVSAPATPVSARWSVLAALLPAGLTIVFGVLPQLLPGYSQEVQLSLPRLIPIALRIGAAGGAWLLLRTAIVHRMAAPGRTSFYAASRLQAAAAKQLMPLRYAARVVHGIGPQRQVMLFLLALLLTMSALAGGVL